MIPLIQSLATAAPPKASQNSPEVNVNDTPQDGQSFDSYLQKKTEEPAEPAEKSPAAPPADPVKKQGVSDDESEAALEAGINPMLGLLPNPCPPVQPTPSPEGEIDLDLSPAVDSTAKEISASELPQPRPDDAVLAMQRDFPPTAAPQPSQNPAQIIAKSPAPPEAPTPAVPGVATVLAIMPQVQETVPIEQTRTLPNAETFPIRGKEPQSQSTDGATTSARIPAEIADTANPAEPISPQPLPASTESATRPPQQPANPPAPAPQIERASRVEPVLREVTPVSPAIESSGMTAANPGSGMSTPAPQRQSKATPATSAVAAPADNAVKVSSMTDVQMVRDASPLDSENRRQSFSDKTSEQPDEVTDATTSIPNTNFTAEQLRTHPAIEAAGSVRKADVAHVVTTTLDAGERLRASGHQSVDLAVKLDNGQEVTIQLRMANGEITPLIRTGSEPLRLALEQNWGAFSQRGGEREIRMTNPVFESPQTSSNMSDLNQQRDGRERTQQEPAFIIPGQYPQRRSGAQTSSQPAKQTSTHQSGVHLYA